MVVFLRRILQIGKTTEMEFKISNVPSRNRITDIRTYFACLQGENGEGEFGINVQPSFMLISSLFLPDDLP
ncbi:hypothetical protein RclHR1_00040008 [Rhizophagus clarus]|uniref:Uncharacterized protein n=1 Tax=Rhizophagus clarus TaxID=94130 RepID=A0A2Z6S8Q3_9GLOM|nr:hypothetical protein RclHR1_00040008 [Rhizophagus clarus]